MEILPPANKMAARRYEMYCCFDVQRTLSQSIHTYYFYAHFISGQSLSLCVDNHFIFVVTSQSMRFRFDEVQHVF